MISALASGLAAAALLGGSFWLGVARATPPAGQGTEFLARGTTVDPPLLEAKGTLPSKNARPWRDGYQAPLDVTALRVTLPAGASTGWHRHPGPGKLGLRDRVQAV